MDPKNVHIYNGVYTLPDYYKTSFKLVKQLYLLQVQTVHRNDNYTFFVSYVSLF